MYLIKYRFYLFCVLCVCLLILPTYNPIFKDEYTEKITYYYYTTNINYNINNAMVINNGNNSIVYCDINNSQYVKQQISNEILSESIRIQNYSQQTYDSVLNKYQNYIVKIEHCDGYSILLCYDNYLSKSINLDNTLVNIQIAISKNNIDIGYPLILNGF